MSDRTRRILAWLPIAGVVALGVRAALVWNRLPAVMMSHFDAHGNPNGWMARTPFFVLAFATTLSMVVLLAITTERVGRRKPVAGLGIVVMNWIGALVLVAVFWGSIDANLYHTRLDVKTFWIAILVLIPVVIAVGIDWRWWASRKRKAVLQGEPGPVQVVAVETHGSRPMAVFFLVIFAVVLLMTLKTSRGPLFPHVVLVLVALLMVACAAWAWRGFAYRFTTAGVEVRALGVRLRRIPLELIKDFRAEEVHPLTEFGGWGVKGFGSDTAYIWGGHTALHIKTFSGDVYLGHKDPDRLVRDLESVMNTAHR